MPNPNHNPSDGLLSAAFVQVSGTGVVAGKTPAAGKPNPANYALTLSVSASGGKAATCQLTPSLVDVANTSLPASLVLASVANAAAGVSVYTGTITGGGSNAFAGMAFTVAGFATAANNGTFICTASTTTTLTLSNAVGVAETHAATAQSYVGSFTYKSYNTAQATVSGSGLITAVAPGQSVVEVRFPTFDASLNVLLGMIYTQIVVQVIP